VYFGGAEAELQDGVGLCVELELGLCIRHWSCWERMQGCVQGFMTRRWSCYFSVFPYRLWFRLHEVLGLRVSQVCSQPHGVQRSVLVDIDI
jgi:hypothetical protein